MDVSWSIGVPRFLEWRGYACRKEESPSLLREGSGELPRIFFCIFAENTILWRILTCYLLECHFMAEKLLYYDFDNCNNIISVALLLSKMLQAAASQSHSDTETKQK